MSHPHRPARIFILLTFLFTLLLSACKTNNDVVSNGLMQKRKHRPGFHLNLKQSATAKQHAALIAKNEHKQRDTLSEREKLDASSPKHLKPLARLNTSGKRQNLQANRKLKLPPIKHSKKHSSSIQKQADERTDELDKLKESTIKNERNLLISGLISFFSLLAMIGFVAALTVGVSSGAVVLSSFILAVIGFIIIQYSLPLFIIYAIERFSLNRGRLYFNEKRIKFFTDLTVTMKRAQLVFLVLTLLGGVFTIVGLVLGIPLLSFIAYIAILIGVNAYVLSSWIGIVSGFVAKSFEEAARKAFMQILIINLVTVVIAVGALVGFIILLTLLFV